jgi:hypothetical protein
MFSPVETFSKKPSLFVGGFSGYTRFLKIPTSYSHIFTDSSMQDMVTQFPDIKIGMGENFDGFLRQDGHSYFFYFRDSLQDFRNLKEHSLNTFSFNLEGFYYQFKKDYFVDSLNQYYEKREILPLYDTVTPDGLLEAILTSIITRTSFPYCDLDLEGEASPYLFRAVVEELCNHGKVYEGFLEMRKWGLLEIYLPEIAVLENIHHDKDYHPEGDALDHILECLKYFNGKNTLLGWAVILHDVGKAVSASNQQRKFDRHAELGTSIADKALTRMGYSEDFIDQVLFLVAHHMHPLFIPYMNDREKENLLDHPLLKELLQLFKIDIMGSHKNMKFYNRMKNMLWRSTEKVY